MTPAKAAAAAAAAAAPLPEWLEDIKRSLPPLMRVPEVADVLRMHPRTVRNHVEAGTLRAVRNVPGMGSSRVLIPRAAVIEWLAKRVVP